MLKEQYTVEVSYQKDPKGKVIYRVMVLRAGLEPKTSHKRYSELKDFNDQVIKNVNLLKLQGKIHVPQFPGRKLFGSTNTSDENIKKRAYELQSYFEELLLIEKVLNLPVVQEFLPIKLNLASTPTNYKQSIRVSIERYQVFDEVVVYYLRLKERANQEEWFYKLRYSELRSIHEALSESKLKVKLPSFPQKKTFGSTNENPDSIEQRREQLESYLNELFSIEEIFNSQVIQYLISDSKADYEKSQKLEEMKRSQQKQVRGDLSAKLKTKSSIDDLSTPKSDVGSKAKTTSVNKSEGFMAFEETKQGESQQFLSS